MKNKVLNLMILLSFFCGFGQQKITWKDLSKVKFTEKYFSKYKEYFLHPKFSPSVKALEGKKLSIKGYFLNIAVEDKVYILSKGPMASCYFCGQGGPETAIEIRFSNKQSFKTDNIVNITGILKLNQDDVEHFNYIFTECKGTLIH